MRTYLRLVYSSGEAPVTRRARREPEEKPRIYPQSASCFRCRERFTDDAAKQIVENDGACAPCAAILDSYPLRSEQGNPDNSEHEWRGGEKC